MDLSFGGEVIHWRGPSPYYFVAVPAGESDLIKAASSLVSYGWGVIPVSAELGQTRWSTSLIPKDGHYLVPLKDLVRRAEALDVGDGVTVRLIVDA